MKILSGITNGRLTKAAALLCAAAIIIAGSTRLRADSGTCGGAMATVPFTDVAGNTFFCSIASAYFSGLTNGTTPTTYSPSAPVPREQMAAFVTRTLDQSLRRGSRRAALGQFWTQKIVLPVALTTVGDGPIDVKSDGKDLWVANSNSGTITRVRASDGAAIGTWTGANEIQRILVANGRVYATATNPNKLYALDPDSPPGPVLTLSSNVGFFPIDLAFDGKRIWMTNLDGVASTFDPLTAAVETISPLTITGPLGILFDGNNIWIVDRFGNDINRMNDDGTINQTVPVGNFPHFPVFDGVNIWVPNYIDDSVTVIRASTGQVIATLTGNGLNAPYAAAFDGERIMVTNAEGNSVSMWKATDLTPITTYNFAPGSGPVGVCSDGINFWIALTSADKLARF